MTGLADFLLARIDEDEAPALALYGAAGAWHLEKAEPAMAAGMLVTEHEHISIWNPDRVLAECEAKVRIVEQGLEAEDAGEQAVQTPTEYGRTIAYEDVLRALALPYADHPEFRDEWRP